MDYEKEKLHIAAEDGNLEKVKSLVSEGFDLNAFDEDLSLTPLHCAAKNENIDVVKFLIAAGAEINTHDEDRIGETPLGEVASSCSYEIAETLIKAGANPIIPGWMGLTALDRAKERKKPDGIRVYELLLKAAKKSFGYKT